MTTLDHTTRTTRGVSGRANVLAGTRHLVRLALRRDRIVLPIWLLVVAVTPAAVADAYDQLYPAEADRAALTASMGGNPSITLLYGPAYDLSTSGGFTAWRNGTMLALVVALVCVFTMTRHTRQEEDTGRQELLSSAVLGRYAALTASVLVCTGFALVTGLVLAVALIAAGLPVHGSLAFGLSLSAVGFVFTGVAALAAQVAEYSRTANGIAAGVLGAVFALRAIGDATADAEWLSWLSPIGWATRVRPFAGERYEVLLPALAVAVVLTACAYGVQSRRDIGRGLIAARPGSAVAAPAFRTPFALAWRLHRGGLVGWLTGFAVLGALFGSLVEGIRDLVGDSDQMRQMLAAMGGSAAVVDAFIAATAGMAGMVAALYAVQAALRMRAEEVALRLEPLLATGVGRLRWLGGHLVFVLGGSAALLTVAGLCLGLVHGLQVSDVAGEIGSGTVACVAQVPAVWVVAGVAVALYGLVPRFATAAWAVAALFLLISMLGPVLDLGQAVLNASPFQHVPKLPSATFEATPLIALSVVALGLVGVGSVAFRRRDIG